MTWELECLEPHGRPARRSLQVRAGEELAVWVLDEPPEARRGLRRTALRHNDQNPPSGARLLVWLSTDGSSITITGTGPRVVVELLRGDVRSQVVPGSRVAGTGSFEAELPDQSRVAFTLTVRQPVARGAATGVALGGTRTSRVRYAVDNVFWQLPDTVVVVKIAAVSLWDAVRDRIQRLGIDSRMLNFLVGILLSATAMGAVALTQYWRAQAQESRAEEAEDALALAKSARQASLATELACLAERQVLVEQLGDLQAAQRTAAEQSLAFTLATSAATEIGGQRLTRPDLVAADTLARDATIAAVLRRIGAATGDPLPCLSHGAALSSDLPPYLLLWHPDPALQCPPTYEAVLDGTRMRGRWGLSDRSAVGFGDGAHDGIGSDPESLAEVTEDPRMEDRWSAFALATGLREVQEALLTAPTDGRPPVLPGEAQLWSLVLLDAYNRMPSPAEGARDASAGACVEALIADLARAAASGGPGQPVLPSVAAIDRGEATVIAPPTPGCPWPRDVLATATDSALHAVARDTTLKLDALTQD